jgi:hypothetical protein
MSPDANKDMVVDNGEIDTLIRRIENIGKVQVHEDRLTAAFSGKSVSSRRMGIIQNLISDDFSLEEKIFELSHQPGAASRLPFTICTNLPKK